MKYDNIDFDAIKIKQKKKGFIWKLSIFAAHNYTTIGNTIYYPKRPLSEGRTMKHEKIHVLQQKEVGLLKFIFLYILCAPFLYNPWRYKWEYEAFKYGSQYPDEIIKKILHSESYGWLVFNKEKY